MQDSSTGLTKRGAVGFGLLFVATGAFALLGVAGVLPRSANTETPVWVGVLIGTMFVLAGASIIVVYGIGPDTDSRGQIDIRAPFGIQLAQYLLGLAIVGSMTAVFGWIAFGPGARHFTASVGSGSGGVGVYVASGGNDRLGRTAFGVGSGLLAVMFLALAVSGARRLAKARAQQSQ